jgi:hypothetical protein
MSDIDKAATGGSATSDTICSAGEMSWFGEECSACAVSVSGHKCKGAEYKNNILCNPGENVANGVCTAGSTDHIE